jgi:hypothetical protein
MRASRRSGRATAGRSWDHQDHDEPAAAHGAELLAGVEPRPGFAELVVDLVAVGREGPAAEQLSAVLALLAEDL